MADLADGYDTYYQARLWASLPAIYRGELGPAMFADIGTATTDSQSALLELVNRIGRQIAVVRRSIDGLWADQSIETCADWAIPYIGYLVATHIVAGLDARGQRLDVANTIGWRRRKGTVTVLDAVARDITGWGIHVQEAFRRLARNRHNLDPRVGGRPPAIPGSAAGESLPAAERLIESLTRTPAGGFADLRSAPGALLTGGPFDQAFHHADLRRGGGAAGWHGTEKLVVYCWRLQSLEVTGGTPVPVSGHVGEYAFDPTGREIPLFLPPPKDTADITGTTDAWQVPGPLTSGVLRVMGAHAPAAYQVSGGTVTVDDVRPESGTFRLSAPRGTIDVSYHYGFGGQIGAGTTDPASTVPLHVAHEILVEPGRDLESTLRSARAGHTITLTDSRTHSAVSGVNAATEPLAAHARQGPLTVRARPGRRPVIRLAEDSQPWVFTGGPDARVVLDGLLVSGGDIVLRGPFDHVKIVGCTLDPGTADPGTADPGTGAGARDDPRAGPGAPALARSVDGRALAPTRLWLEGAPGPQAASPGAIRCLEVERSILGPIRTRNRGLAESIKITDSIVQGFRTSASAELTAEDIFDPALLYDQLSPGRPIAERRRAQPNPLSAFIWKSVGGHVPERARRQLLGGQPGDAAGALADALNRLIGRDDIYRPELFRDVTFSPPAHLAGSGRGAMSAPWRNRLLLENAYPLALAPAATAVADATVILNRVTILGRLVARRLHATDSILHGSAAVDDTGNGCVQYSAARAGSRLPPQQYSAELSHGGALFTSTAFGRPGYGQLLDTADNAILRAEPGATLLAGASSGGGMGSFSTQIVPIKEHALRVKYHEYLPVGLTPVIVHVT
jgi:hypothetical protein